MLRLFIEDKEVELNESVQVAITKQFEDLSNPTTIINDWSKTVSIPFTQNNHKLFGHIYSPDRIISAKTSSSLISTPSRIKKWGGSGYVDDSLVSGEIVCDLAVQYLQLGFQNANWEYTAKEDYSCNNDTHTYEFIYDSTRYYRLEFSFRDLSSEADNKEVYFVQWDLAGLGLAEGETYIVSFSHRKNGNNSIIYDWALIERQPITGLYFDPYKKLNFRLQWSDTVIMTGYAKMNEIKQSNKKGTYELTLFGQLGKVFQDLKKITFDKTSKEYDYYLDGSEYVSEYINSNLVYESWNVGGQVQSKLFPKWYTPPGTSTPIIHPAYKVTDIIGFAPNNSFSEGFDYTTYQHSSSSSGNFTDALGDSFKNDTGIDPDVVIPDGLLPREIGEYRSYLQLPYIYFNKLFQIFQKKAEKVTGYTFELSESWFNKYNPYWFNLVYMLSPLNTKKSETLVNHYNPTTYTWTWQGKTTTNRVTWDVMIPTTAEVFKLVEDFNVYPSKFVVSDDFSVILSYNLGLELLDKGSSDPYSLRLSDKNYLKLYVNLLNAETNASIYVKTYAIMDNDCIFKDTLGSHWEKLLYGELTRTGTYPNRKRYITINPNFSYLLKKSTANKFKIQITAEWANTEPRFMTKYTESDSYTYVTPLTELVDTDNSTITAETDYTRRSNTRITLNNLWNNKYNLFEEILKYCKMYRISISVDELNKKIIFKPFTEYFSNYSVIDWTNKVDKSKDFNIKPITFENKYVSFNYEKLDTYLGEKYSDKFGMNFGEYKLKTDYNFNTETTKLFDKITQSMTNTDNVLSWNNLYNKHKIVYSFPKELFVYNKDEDNKQVDIFGSYYFYTGATDFDTDPFMNLRSVYITDDTYLQESTNKYFYNQSSTDNTRLSTSKYPKLDIVYGNEMCVFNIPSENYTYNANYSSCYSIYNNFWKKYLEERYNIQNKLITCYVDLTPSDYNNFSWSNLVKLGNQICLVNKIYDYDVTSSSPTKVDLVTIQDVEAYGNDSFLHRLDRLNLSWDYTLYLNYATNANPITLGSVESLSEVTFENGLKTFTKNGVTFTINNGYVLYQCVSEYLDGEDKEFAVVLKNKYYTTSFNVVRYSTYPYPRIILENSSGQEITRIVSGARTLKLKWSATDTYGLENKPTVVISTNGVGTYSLGNDWGEEQIMIAEGDDEWFRNEYSVSLTTNMSSANNTYLRIKVTDKEGWHETRDYPIL